MEGGGNGFTRARADLIRNNESGGQEESVDKFRLGPREIERGGLGVNSRLMSVRVSSHD